MKTHVSLIRVWIFACSLAAARLAPAAWGADSAFYLRGDGGANLIEEINLDLAGTPGKMKFDSGYRVDLALGYEVTKWAAVEIEGGFFDNSPDSMTLAGSSAPVHGSDLQGIPLLANIVLRYENASDFVPYIGAGAGGVVGLLDLSGNNDSAFVFAYQVFAGIAYKLEEQAWIDVGYKFLVMSDQQYEVGSTPLKFEKLHSHFLGVSVTWKF